jgi:N-acetylmuramoyl-L-alanine amidase
MTMPRSWGHQPGQAQARHCTIVGMFKRPATMHFARCWRLLAAALPAMLLGACATGPAPLLVDTRYTAVGQDSRAQYLILHYTDEPLDSSIRILTQQKVSAHYLLSDEAPPVVYRLVDENRRAWHAGASFWKGATQLNASSIGIEIVNLGEEKAADGTRFFTPYPPAQIELLIQLVRDIVTRHHIPPERVLGHSDIAPQRKIDPGPLFPWKALADAGLVPWPDASRVAAHQLRYAAALPEVAWFQRSLAAVGYQVPDTGVLDAPTQRVLIAFQMRYRPAKYDGQPDAETAALLQVINEPLPQPRPQP